MRRILPNFFIIGAAKAATTSLSSLLALHHQAAIVQGKEPHFFSYEMRYRKMQPQFAVQTRLALKNGIGRDDLMAVANQFAVFYGFPMTLNAFYTIDGIADELEILSAEPVGIQQQGVAIG